LDTQTKQPAGRNDPCPCGSGKKYKNCHLDADEKKAREARSKAAEAASAAAPAEPAAGPATASASAGAAPPKAKGKAPQPWKRGTANTRGFQRTSATRKVGGGS
jgi:preprotein translocase subunit SecA